jgi:hypothetical protein
MAEIFTRQSHHQAVTVVFTAQNLFNSKKFSKTIARNLTALIVFENNSDVNLSQYISRMCLGKQLFLDKSFKLLNEINSDAKCLKYLLVRCDTNLISKKYRVFSNIFPDESPEPFNFTIPLVFHEK